MDCPTVVISASHYDQTRRRGKGKLSWKKPIYKSKRTKNYLEKNFTQKCDNNSVRTLNRKPSVNPRISYVMITSLYIIFSAYPRLGLYYNHRVSYSSTVHNVHSDNTIKESVVSSQAMMKLHSACESSFSILRNKAIPINKDFHSVGRCKPCWI